MKMFFIWVVDSENSIATRDKQSTMYTFAEVPEKFHTQVALLDAQAGANASAEIAGIGSRRKSTTYNGAFFLQDLRQRIKT